MRIMAEGFLKEQFQTKLKMVGELTQMLPPQLKDQVRDFQQSILRVVYEVTKEYGRGSSDCGRR